MRDMVSHLVYGCGEEGDKVKMLVRQMAIREREFNFSEISIIKIEIFI